VYAGTGGMASGGPQYPGHARARQPEEGRSGGADRVAGQRTRGPRHVRSSGADPAHRRGCGTAAGEGSLADAIQRGSAGGTPGSGGCGLGHSGAARGARGSAVPVSAELRGHSS